MAQAFRDLKVWKKAIELSVSVYRFTRPFPREELYGLVSQMRRASVSIASNIAEGSARRTRREFRQFVKLAEGSNCELQTQLLIARQLGFGNADHSELNSSLQRNRWSSSSLTTWRSRPPTSLAISGTYAAGCPATKR